eukprot:TRINITY_DN19250_c0_g1_i1.p4 TRINITY_DN19250_c0_g1~~TRINITY_DN19250_c0_g1_i1.p4  ORF type:complete len:217 (-),score=-8.80 TRINITY_DN19250_c0_g1_i1:1108-1758(-)
MSGQKSDCFRVGSALQSSLLMNKVAERNKLQRADLGRRFPLQFQENCHLLHRFQRDVQSVKLFGPAQQDSFPQNLQYRNLGLFFPLLNKELIRQMARVELRWTLVEVRRNVFLSRGRWSLQEPEYARHRCDLPCMYPMYSALWYQRRVHGVHTGEITSMPGVFRFLERPPAPRQKDVAPHLNQRPAQLNSGHLPDQFLIQQWKKQAQITILKILWK